MEAAQAHGSSCNGAAGLLESLSLAHGTGASGVPLTGEPSWVLGAEARTPHAPAGGGGVSAGSGARLDWGGDEAAGRTMSPAAFLQDGALPFTPLHVLLAPQLSR